jgi:type II secretory pathway predicted ATPase ExeA/phage tail protein X
VYHQFYGLSESPFGLTPDPRYLFASEGHKEALAHIAYGIEERRGFVLILGEVGTGKTTLVRHVLGRLGPDVKSVFIFNPSLGFEELLQAVLRDLEVPSPGRRRVDLIDALNDFLLQENAAGRRVVLIIDEAQHLPASVLEDIRMLSNLETARSKLLQIVLVGQPELGERLGQPNLRQLRQRIGLAAELKPLNRSDSAKYIKHRLGVAGCLRPVFTPLALRTVYRKSGGIPRLINVMCDKALVLGYGANKRRIGRGIVKQVAQDWTVFRVSGRAASTPAPVRRNAERRIRRAPRGTRLGQVVAAVVVGALIVTGLLVVRLGTPDQTAAVGLPAPAVSSIQLGVAPEPGAPQPLVTSGSGPELAVADRAPGNDVVPDQSKAEAPTASDAAPPLGAPRSDGPASIVTVNTGDTLSWLLYSVYGRADETVADLVQRANPGLGDVDQLRTGQRLRFPTLEPAAMIHKVADGRYLVHLLTTSKPTDSQFRKLRADILSAGRTVRLEPVRLGTLRTTWYRVWVGDFSSSHEAETFYRRRSSGEAA